MSEQDNVVAKVKIDKNSAEFFSKMVKNGLATFEKDSSLNEGEGNAVIKNQDGNFKLFVRAIDLPVLSIVSD